MHNLPFHLWALDQPAFLDGSYTTHFVEQRVRPAQTGCRELDEGQTEALIAAAALFEALRRGDAGERRRRRRLDGRRQLAAERPARHDRQQVDHARKGYPTVWMKKRYVLNYDDEPARCRGGPRRRRDPGPGRRRAP